MNSDLRAIKLSLTPSATEPEKIANSTAAFVLAAIKDGRWRDKVEAVRRKFLKHGGGQAGKDAVKDDKKRLPGVLWSGIFTRRANAALVSHSGMVCLDLDLIDDLQDAKEKLAADPHILTCYLSTTGAGLKAVIPMTPIPRGLLEHRAAFAACCEHIGKLGLTACNDDGTSDVARMQFISFDPDLRIREDAVPLPFSPISPSSPPAQKRTDGNNGTDRDKPSKEKVRSMLAVIPKRPNYDDWIRIVAAVGDALDDDDAVEVLNEWSEEEKPGEYADKLEQRLADVRVGTLIHIAKQHGWSDYAGGENGEFVEIAVRHFAEIRANSPISPNSPRPQKQPAIYPPDSLNAEWMGFARDLAESADCYLDGAIHPIIGAILARRVWFQWGVERKYPNCFNLLAGAAGDRKSSAIMLAFALGRRILPADAFIPDTFSPETLFDEYDEQSGGRPDKLWIQDDANPVLMDWRKTAYGERVATRFLNLYDCRGLRERFRRNKTKETPETLRSTPETSTSLLFGATFNIACFQGQEIKAGIARRFLYYVAEEHGRMIIRPRAIPAAELDRLVALFARLETLKGPMDFTPTAGALWSEYQRSNRATIARTSQFAEEQRHRLNSAPLQVLQLAMRFQASTWGMNGGAWDGLITESSLQCAIEHHTASLTAASFLDTIATREEVTSEAEILLAHIRRNYKAERGVIIVRRSELTHRFCGHSGRRTGWKPDDLYLRFIPALERQGDACLVKMEGRAEVYAFRADEMLPAKQVPSPPPPDSPPIMPVENLEKVAKPEQWEAAL